MDKGTIRVLESIGYVAAVLIVTGSLLKDMGAQIPMLVEIGIMTLGIVLVRMAGIIARNMPSESPAVPVAKKAEQPARGE